MKIGFTELLVVFFVALIVIGPDKLPQYAKKFGEALAVFRKATDEATGEIKKNIVEPLEEAQKPLREAMEPVEELRQSVRGNLRDVEKSLNQVGKPKPSPAAARQGAAAEPEAMGDTRTEPETAADAETVPEPSADSGTVPEAAAAPAGMEA